MPMGDAMLNRTQHRNGPYMRRGPSEEEQQLLRDSDLEEQFVRQHADDGSSAMPVDADADPLFDELDTMFAEMGLESPALAITRERFVEFDGSTAGYELPKDVQLPHAIEKLIVSSYKAYHKLCDEVNKTLFILKKDAENLKTGQLPKNTSRSSMQFRQEVQEEFAPRREQQVKEEALQQLRLKVEANKAWVLKQKSSLTPLQQTTQVLACCYDELAESSGFTEQMLLAFKSFIVLKAFNEFVKIKQSCDAKHIDTYKAKKADEEKRESDNKIFEQFMCDYPTVAMAVYFREMEERIMSVMMAQEDKRHQAYVHARKGQSLSRLESLAYNYKEELQKKQMPFLASRASTFLKDRGPKQQRSRSRTKSANATRDRSTSRASSKSKGSTQSHRSQRPRASSGRRDATRRISQSSGRSQRSASLGSAASRQSSSKGKGKSKKGKGKGKGKGKARRGRSADRG